MKGTIKTDYRILESTCDPVSFLKSLDPGKHCFLLESADLLEGSGEKSIGCPSPCIRLRIEGDSYEIVPLTDQGKDILEFIRGDLPGATMHDDRLDGSIMTHKSMQEEEARIKDTGVFDIARKLATSFTPQAELDMPYCGLFGMIGYDAIDYIEDLPGSSSPKMDFYLATDLFVMDHLRGKTFIISNTFITGKEDRSRSFDIIRRYEKAFRSCTGIKQQKIQSSELVPSVDDEKFKESVSRIKEHILNGDIFQCVLSRSFTTMTDADPIDIYSNLKSINPGPYMFYFKNDEEVLLGSSPETCLKVSKDRKVEIRPIAGTLPRGRKDGRIDKDLDSRFELELKLDEKELAEHCMLVDLARNDIAKISEPGTRVTEKLLDVEKFSHVQHLVSSVSGTLKKDLDALHAYAATMNMGTLTGAPKIKAMELIKKYEETPRGYYGGAVCYLTPDGEFDSCIIIRAISMKDGKATIRAGAGIVHDSDPQKEADETRRKASACFAALGARS